MNRSFGNSLILVVVCEVLLSVFLLLFADPILKGVRRYRNGL